MARPAGKAGRAAEASARRGDNAAGRPHTTTGSASVFRPIAAGPVTATAVTGPVRGGRRP